MWVEPFCRCAPPFHHFHHFLLDRPPVILPQSHLPTLPLSHCSNTFPHSPGQTKNKFPLLLIFGNIFTERKNANTYLSLPYAKLVRNCPHPPKKERQYSFTHTLCQVSFQFHIHYFTCAGCVCEMCDCMTPWARRVRNCPYPLTVFCSQCPSISTDHYKY